MNILKIFYFLKMCPIFEHFRIVYFLKMCPILSTLFIILVRSLIVNKILLSLDAYVVSCPTCTKHLGRYLTKVCITILSLSFDKTIINFIEWPKMKWSNKNFFWWSTKNNVIFMDSEATKTCGLNDLHFVHNRRLVVGSVAHVVISYAVF